MNATAAWSTQATPLANVAGALVFILGAFSLVYSALTLVLGGAAWNVPAYLCLALTASLLVLRLRRLSRRTALSLCWDGVDGCFRIAGMAGPLQLTEVSQGPGWVTLGLRHPLARNRALRLVIWKLAVPAPSWSELALRIEAAMLRGNGHQNKENP